MELEEFLKLIAESTDVDPTRVTTVASGDVLRKIAERLLHVAAEVDAGTKTLCPCSTGAVIGAPSGPNGEPNGMQFQVDLHFVDINNPNAARH